MNTFARNVLSVSALVLACGGEGPAGPAPDRTPPGAPQLSLIEATIPSVS